MSEQPNLGEFLQNLASNPKLMETIAKRAELDKFKETYNTERASPLRCPACNQYGVNGGSLWIHKDDPYLFTCRKCKLTFRLECKNVDNEKLIYLLKELNKGDKGSEEAVYEWDKLTHPNKEKE